MPGAGLCPAKILKPIFKKQTAASQTTACSPAVATKPATIPAQAPVAAPQIPKANTTDSKVILRKVSFKHFGNKTAAKTDEGSQDTPADTMNVQKPLEENSMMEAWHAYVNRLPREQMAIAQRIRMLQPAIEDSSTIGITVNNPQIINELNDLKADLEGFLRTSLQNNAIQLSFHLSEEKDVQRSYSKQELLVELEKMNPSLTSLIKELELEFD